MTTGLVGRNDPFQLENRRVGWGDGLVGSDGESGGGVHAYGDGDVVAHCWMYSSPRNYLLMVNSNACGPTYLICNVVSVIKKLIYFFLSRENKPPYFGDVSTLTHVDTYSVVVTIFQFSHKK